MPVTRTTQVFYAEYDGGDVRKLIWDDLLRRGYRVDIQTIKQENNKFVCETELNTPQPTATQRE